MHYNCLIVDDERPLAESTAEYFNLFSVSTAVVFDAEGCHAFLKQNTTDLILLDINLEQSSGFILCKELRQHSQIPVLFISARQSEDDMILGLTIGGDDYIRKPYSLGVLLAKVKAVLKRCAAGEDTYSCGRLSVDFQTGRVFVENKPVKLKAMEYKLLCYLIRNRGRIIPKEELFCKVWENAITGDGTLNVHIRHLREQIEEQPGEPAIIRTIWGTGYIFEEPVR